MRLTFLIDFSPLRRINIELNENSSPDYYQLSFASLSSTPSTPQKPSHPFTAWTHQHHLRLSKELNDKQEVDKYWYRLHAGIHDPQVSVPRDWLAPVATEPLQKLLVSICNVVTPAVSSFFVVPNYGSAALGSLPGFMELGLAGRIDRILQPLRVVTNNPVASGST